MIVVIAEALFWVLVAAGMVVRYWLRMPILSKFLLLAVPLVDVALVIAVIAELHGGRPVGIEHQLVGLYLGISLILGPGIIRRCDKKTRSLSSREKSSPRPHPTFNEKMRGASSMPLGSILVVAFFGPGWLLLLGDNDKQQKTSR